MSRTFTDEGLMTWEAYASSGEWGLPDQPAVVFNPLSDTTLRPRYVELSGDEADAEELVLRSDESKLRELLRQAKPID